MLEIKGYTFTYIEFVCIVAFILGFLVQFWNYVLKMGFILNKRKEKTSEFPSISIVVTARNYEPELKENLPAILGQDYPDFEVVVVDDCSFDKTSECLATMKLTYSNLKTTSIKQVTDFSNALAVSMGIRAASKEWVVFLHPQCKLSDPGWLNSYSKNLREGINFVFGYSRLNYKKGFFNNLVCYNNFYYYLFCGGAIRVGSIYPYSPINLAYRRKIFFEKKGFAGQLDSRLCENEMFASKLALKTDTCFVPEGQSVVDVEGNSGWKDWVNLRKNHLLLKKEFSVGKRFYMRLDVLTRVGVNVLLPILLMISKFYLWILALWAFRLVLESSLALIARKRLTERSVIPGILFYDIFLPFFDVVVWWNLYIEGRKKRWK